jgi:hypothetical protein
MCLVFLYIKEISSRPSALQAPSPEFKPQSHQENKEKKDLRNRFLGLLQDGSDRDREGTRAFGKQVY